jgi:hypothetical protein
LNIGVFDFDFFIPFNGIRDSVVGIATGYGLDEFEFESESESRCCQEFSFLHAVQTGSGVHPNSYPMVTRGSFSDSKAAGM